MWKIWQNQGMENLTTSFDYPIVFKHIHGYLTISIPDLGISEKIKFSKKHFNSAVFNENKIEILVAFLEVLKLGENHLKTKKWIPEPSQIKSQLKKAEKDYSLPEFRVALSPYLNLSENTLRREIQRGRLICYTTEGGHRRIPHSELGRYIQDLKNK